MPVNKEKYFSIVEELKEYNAVLVAVSKTKPVSDILELYKLGQTDFGENYVQELVEKQQQLPTDIRWHFIGHLQRNKIKLIAPFVHLIHGVDSLKLLMEINKEAKKCSRIIDVLLQVHIAKEESKFGFDEKELAQIFESLQSQDSPILSNTKIVGLMGMASFTTDNQIIQNEFHQLKLLFHKHAQLQTPNLSTEALAKADSSTHLSVEASAKTEALGKADTKLQTLSTGMSADYKIALQEGSNMVRIGSLLFGARQ